MPNYKVVDTEKLDAGLVATADAIRAKTKSEDSISWSSERGFADAIEEIKDKKVFSRYDDVCFWDYEGTLVYSCSLAEAQTMTELPQPPDHSNDEIPLVFEEWNWTLEEINALQRKADIGAIYTPADEKTHFSIRLTPTTDLDVTLNWSQYSSATRTMTIDWGDGNIEDYVQGSTGQTSYSHTYATEGVYNCSINPNGLGWNPAGSSSLVSIPGNYIIIGTVIFDRFAGWGWPGGQGLGLLSNSQMEACVFPPKMVTPTAGRDFLSSAFLKHVNMPRTVTTFLRFGSCYDLKRVSYCANVRGNWDYMFSSCTSLEEVRLPQGFDFSARFCFTDVTSLKFIDLPEGITNLPMRIFKNCYGLKEIHIPSTVVNIVSDAFNNTGALDYFFYSTVPPALTDSAIFNGIKKNAIIHVPSASLEAYQTATNWATWADYMVGDL